MVQLTVALIKPDGVMKGLEEEIVKRYIEAGLYIVLQARLQFSESQIREFYREHKGRPYFEGLVLSMTSGPCVALFLEGENAIQLVRKLNGATDPAKAAPGTIRHDFPSAGGPFNVVHGSSSDPDVVHESLIVTKAISEQ